MSETQNRMCPVCGTVTDLSHCPKDGTGTIGAVAFTKHPRSYEAGDIVGERYRITGELGAGGFAAVFAAEHTGTHQPVAVKLLALDPSEESARVTVRRFFREAQVTAKLSSPHTVRIFDVGQDDGGALYIAMELLRGESLEGLLKRRLRASDPLTEAETIDLAVPILDSLAEAHAHGLVHRDLKPANIFLSNARDGSLQVKVLDFGIARTADSSLTLGGSIPGTPPFMSPEQCRGEEVDGRSDLYALAVMLFLCTTAKLPFHHTNVLKLMRMHAFDPPPDPRTMTDRPLSDGFVSLLMRCMAKQPSMRPLTAQSLSEELIAVRHGSWSPGAWDGQTGSDATVAIVRPSTSEARRAQRASGGLGEPEAAPERSARPPSGAVGAAPAGAAFAQPRREPSSGFSAPTGNAAVVGGVGAAVAAPEVPVAAVEDAAPAVVRRSRTGWIVAIVALIVVGAGVGVLFASRSTDAAALEAEVAARYALKETDPARRVQLARDAVRLAPANPAYQRLLADSEALLAAQPAPPVPVVAAPIPVAPVAPVVAAPVLAAPAPAAPAPVAPAPAVAAPAVGAPAPAVVSPAPAPAPTQAGVAPSVETPLVKPTATRAAAPGPSDKPGPNAPAPRPKKSIASEFMDD